jgi:hypothetical protein
MVEINKGLIQIVGITSITIIVVVSLILNQTDFATNVGMVGVGAVAGFLGNETLNQLDGKPE